MKKLTKKPPTKCCSVHMVQKDPEFFDEKTPDEKTCEKTLVNGTSLCVGLLLVVLDDVPLEEENLGVVGHPRLEVVPELARQNHLRLVGVHHPHADLRKSGIRSLSTIFYLTLQ